MVSEERIKELKKAPLIRHGGIVYKELIKKGYSPEQIKSTVKDIQMFIDFKGL